MKTTKRFSRRDFLRTAVAAGAASWALSAAGADGPRRTPNIVVILTDDQGYQDVGCFGSPNIKTPNLDRMAAEGVRFTDFYVAAASCTPSRAALLTGCYPQRIGLPNVLNHSSKVGIHDDEITLADLLKARGYATACFGKWHLGCQKKFLPIHHGFDEYFGLPYSNDMWPNHPTSDKYPPLPLIEGDEVIEYQPDQNQLTRWYTEHAVSFIERNKERPFFLYLPHSMPHVPLHGAERFRGKSEQGRYGDIIMEIDWSVGEVLAALKRCGVDDNTLVIYTSDNGPWLSYGDHAGSALPLREGKGTTFDGGQREPCIMRWPGRIPAGSVCTETCASIDILPTVAGLAGAEVPKDRVIDGRDIWPLLSGQAGARTPHEAFFFIRGRNVEAVRSGSWKLHVEHKYRSLVDDGGTGGQPAPYEMKTTKLALFDLGTDIGEQNNVAAEHPEVVARLKAMIEAFRRDLRENSRPPGRVDEA